MLLYQTTSLRRHSIFPELQRRQSSQGLNLCNVVLCHQFEFREQQILIWREISRIWSMLKCSNLLFAKNLGIAAVLWRANSTSNFFFFQFSPKIFRIMALVIFNTKATDFTVGFALLTIISSTFLTDLRVLLTANWPPSGRLSKDHNTHKLFSSRFQNKFIASTFVWRDFYDLKIHLSVLIISASFLGQDV